MTEVLILGGTGWLSGAITRQWLARDARVTCLARGLRAAPEGARVVIADRDAADAYDGVAGQGWDEIVDISSRPSHVRAAVDALGSRARHWTYISSVSVYADNADVDADESAALAEPATSDDDDYSRAKVAAERAVGALGERAAIVRPGLIVGPGDPTDRFGYWVSRFALAGAEAVLVPDAADARVQVIDVDDLAAFAAHVGESRWDGVANAVGPSFALSDVLDAARMVAGHVGAVVPADVDWLTAQNVAHWAGPRSLPLWLPEGMPGFAARNADVYAATGGIHRLLREVLDRVLSDERARGLSRTRVSGLTRDDELALLAALAAA